MELVEKRPILQIINKDAEFRPSFRQDLKQWEFDRQGLDYFIVAVLGVQSSGKSTLLNLLFGTGFDVMDAKVGRNQTTLGVWLGLSGTKSLNVLVFDVEGTDSRERGEDHGIFERKTSLFSLALSEILLINMWAHDVGRFEGANYSLLKIVFEMNLRLFRDGRASKTLLYFVFRDHDPEETPLERLAETISADMGKLWDAMPKPDKFAASSIRDFFDFRFTSLPHKMLKDKFQGGVLALRQEFIDPSSPTYVLSRTYKTDVPADGLSHYAERIWETIQAEKDLNLPSQKQMLAVYRCDEILKETFALFEGRLDEWRAPLAEGQLLTAFGASAATAVQVAIGPRSRLFPLIPPEQYDAAAGRYDPEIAEQKRADLRTRLGAVLHMLFQQQLKLALTHVKATFGASLLKTVAGGEPKENFLTLAHAIKAEIQQRFRAFIAEAAVAPFDWPTKGEEEDLASFIDSKVEEERRNQLKLFADSLGAQFDAKALSRVGKLLDSPDGRMWPQVEQLYGAETKDAADRFQRILDTFEAAPQEQSERLRALEQRCFAALRSLLLEKVKNVDLLMNRRFRNEFELDDGVPRLWGALHEDLAVLWVRAKLNAEQLVDLFAVLRLKGLEKASLFRVNPDKKVVEPRDTPSDVPAEHLLISVADGQRLLERFREFALGPYQVAVAEQERARASRGIPAYFLVLLAVLGFNEFMWLLQHIIFNPFMLVFALLFAGIAFALWRMNMWPIIRQVLSPIVRKVDQQVRERVGELLHGPPPPRRNQTQFAPAAVDEAERKKKD